MADIYDAAASRPDAGEEYERQVRRVYSALVTNGDVAIDVGGYEGKHALPLAIATGTDGHCYVAEPNPQIHPILKGRIELARALGANVQLFEGCVADAVQSEAPFHVVPDHVGWSSLIPRESVGETIELKVPVTTIDDWLPAQHRGRVRFVKVDCEGAEIRVLSGAASMLRQSKPVIHLEIALDALEVHGWPVDQLVEYIADRWLVFDCLGFLLDTEDEIKTSFCTRGPFDYFLIDRASPTLGNDLARVECALLEGFDGFVTRNPASADLLGKTSAYCGRSIAAQSAMTFLDDSEDAAGRSAPAKGIVPAPEKRRTHYHFVSDEKNTRLLHADGFIAARSGEGRPLPLIGGAQLTVKGRARTSFHLSGRIATKKPNANLSLLEISDDEVCVLARIRGPGAQTSPVFHLMIFVNGVGEGTLSVDVAEEFDIVVELSLDDVCLRGARGALVLPWSAAGERTFSISYLKRANHVSEEAFEGRCVAEVLTDAAGAGGTRAGLHRWLRRKVGGKG